jgi:hypothetical protein
MKSRRKKPTAQRVARSLPVKQTYDSPPDNRRIGLESKVNDVAVEGSDSTAENNGFTIADISCATNGTGNEHPADASAAPSNHGSTRARTLRKA